MAQITEIIMTAYEKLQKLITDGDVYTKSQLDEKLGEIETKFGTEVATKIKEMVDNGEIGALTIGDNTLDTIKFKDGAIKGAKKYRGNGIIIQNDAISVYLADKKVVVNKNVQVYLDNSVPFVATAGTELTYTALYDIALYVDLTDNKLKCGDIKSIPNAHLLLATVNITDQVCNLLGNDMAIAVYSTSGLRIYDTNKFVVQGAIGNKVNVKITDLTLSLELTDVSTTRIFSDGIMTTVASVEGLTVTALTDPVHMLFNTSSKKLFLKGGITISINRLSTDSKNIVHICTFVPSTGVIEQINAGSIHNIFINSVDYFEDTNSARLNNSVDSTFKYSDYGMVVDKNNAIKPNIFNTSLVSEGGMLVSIAGKNANWNQQYSSISGKWVDGYDSGNGGHALQCYAKNKQYRLTGLLDFRRNDNKLPMASFFNWMPPLNKFGWLRLGCDDYGKFTNESGGLRYGGIEVTDRIARMNTPLVMQPNPYEEYLPQDYEIDEFGGFVKDTSGKTVPKTRVALTNYNVFQSDKNSELVYKKKGSDTYKQIAFIEDLEKELMALTSLHNASLNIENNMIVLPNHKRNGITIDAGLIKKVKRIGKYVINGTENWTVKTVGTTANIFACSGLTMDAYSSDYNNSNINMLSDKAICRYTSSATLLEGETVVAMGRGGVKGFLLLISTDLATDVETLKTYLASNNITVYYELATEVLETVTS